MADRTSDLVGAAKQVNEHRLLIRRQRGCKRINPRHESINGLLVSMTPSRHSFGRASLRPGTGDNRDNREIAHGPNCYAQSRGCRSQPAAVLWPRRSEHRASSVSDHGRFVRHVANAGNYCDRAVDPCWRARNRRRSAEELGTTNVHGTIQTSSSDASSLSREDIAPGVPSNAIAGGLRWQLPGAVPARRLGRIAPLSQRVALAD